MMFVSVCVTQVPNTDQPYACVDMMVTGVVLDKVGPNSVSLGPGEETALLHS